MNSHSWHPGQPSATLGAVRHSLPSESCTTRTSGNCMSTAKDRTDGPIVVTCSVPRLGWSRVERLSSGGVIILSQLNPGMYSGVCAQELPRKPAALPAQYCSNGQRWACPCPCPSQSALSGSAFLRLKSLQHSHSHMTYLCT